MSTIKIIKLYLAYWLCLSAEIGGNMFIVNSFSWKRNTFSVEKNLKMSEWTLLYCKLVIVCFFHDLALGFASCEIMKKTYNNLHL